MYSEPFWTAISLKQGRYHAVVERTVSWDNFSYFDGYFGHSLSLDYLLLARDYPDILQLVVAFGMRGE